MRTLVLGIVLLAAAELTNGCDKADPQDDRCSPMPSECLHRDDGRGELRWYLNGTNTCSGVKTSCKDKGFSSLGDCYTYCISD
uniref:Putative conserved secreted protein n=1 Tax=Amblyomma tuberculatum TaxID=48802 RepID=A0A6M2E0A8_9ACAR